MSQRTRLKLPLASQVHIIYNRIFSKCAVNCFAIGVMLRIMCYGSQALLSLYRGNGITQRKKGLLVPWAETLTLWKQARLKLVFLLYLSLFHCFACWILQEFLYVNIFPWIYYCCFTLVETHCSYCFWHYTELKKRYNFRVSSIPVIYISESTEVLGGLYVFSYYSLFVTFSIFACVRMWLQ